MERLAVLALGLVLVTVALPATVAGEDEQSIREQNRQWILEHNPDYDPDAIVELHTADGVEEMTAAEALERALDRAGDTLLPDVASDEVAGESALTGTVVGDIWLIAVGSVDCGERTELADSPIPFTPVDPQLWIYDGVIGYVTDASADVWIAISWTQKETLAGTGTFHYGGIIDDFCIDGGGFFSFLFPFLDGYVTTLAGPPALP